MRVAIDARLVRGTHGGVESVVLGLAHGLTTLTDSDDEYLLLAWQQHDAYLEPVLGGPVRILHMGERLERGVRVKARLARLRLDQRAERDEAPSANRPPLSDETVERAGVHLVHFTLQSGFRTHIPSIYQPHDLQHVHLPQFFSPDEIAWREGWYRTLASQAAMVAVASRWTKQDMERHLGLAPRKVHVVPYAPSKIAMDLDERRADELRAGLGIDGGYILFPAQTWPHKNHEGLLRALASLRERDGMVVPLVCPGAQNEYFPEISRIESELRLSGQVRWPGFVSAEELQALYLGATAVVIPTRFEAGSFPLWEAFQAGVAAACSNVTSLPEQAGDAALHFDPDDIEAIAHAVAKLWTDAELRAALIAKGRARIGGLSWERTARTFRAHYRRLSGRALDDEDLGLMAAQTPM
jgi:glycosyltransferase involved in cell wall biosynthesis